MKPNRTVTTAIACTAILVVAAVVIVPLLQMAKLLLFLGPPGFACIWVFQQRRIHLALRVLIQMLIWLIWITFAVILLMSWERLNGGL